MRDITNIKGISICVFESILRAGQRVCHKLTTNSLTSSVTMFGTGAGDDLEDGFKIETNYLESDENAETVVQEPTKKKKKRKRDGKSEETPRKVLN